MSNQLGRKIIFGSETVQQDDGTWVSEVEMEVLDHEHMPTTFEEVEAHVRKDLHPDVKLAADSAADLHEDPLKRAVAIVKAVKDLPKAQIWALKRSVLDKSASLAEVKKNIAKDK